MVKNTEGTILRGEIMSPSLEYMERRQWRPGANLAALENVVSYREGEKSVSRRD